MATNTTKLGLIKPALADVVDVGNLNDNADSIDAAVGFTVCTSATRPAAPWAGQPIFETDTALSLVWDGDSWEAAGGGGGGVTISATAPVAPTAGDMWWDSVNGELYLYYDDGTSSQWVAAAGPSVTVASVAPTGYEGQLWLDDTDGSMYVYYTDPGGGASSWIGAVSRSGGILQVVSTTKTDTFSTTSTSFVDVTGLSASITPRSTSSKIIVNVSVSLGGELADGLYPSIFDGSNNNILVPDSPGSRVSAYRGGVFNGTPDLEPAPFTIVHSPNTTSSFTYKVRVRVSGGTGYVNRASSDTDSSARTRGVSTITLMEVAG